jgi:hypothetical protein
MERHTKPDELSPFERLKRFARAIVAVPKAELDEKEAEYQQQKMRRKELRATKGGALVKTRGDQTALSITVPLPVPTGGKCFGCRDTLVTDRGICLDILRVIPKSDLQDFDQLLKLLWFPVCGKLNIGQPCRA